jgi:tripartite-type tricarboxylate transporter receptor subunit TctC
MAILMSIFYPATMAADPWPNKPIKIIIPFSPGSVQDALARSFSNELGAALGVSVLVENKAGAGGTVGTGFTAKSAPDGYTFLLAAASHNINGSLFSKLSFDPIKDFTGAAYIGTSSYVMMTNAEFPAKSVAEFMALAKREPGKLTYGSSGIGSNVHFIFEYLKLRTGLDVSHVPYRGAGPMVNDLLAGNIDCSFDGTSKQNIEAGRLKALAVASIKRDVLYPDLMTLDEAGVKGFNLPGWQSLMGPKGMPPAIVKKLNEAANAAVKNPLVISRLSAIGFHAYGGTPEELQKWVANDTATFQRIAKDAGIQLQ